MTIYDDPYSVYFLNFLSMDLNDEALTIMAKIVIIPSIVTNQNRLNFFSLAVLLKILDILSHALFKILVALSQKYISLKMFPEKSPFSSFLEYHSSPFSLFCPYIQASLEVLNT